MKIPFSAYWRLLRRYLVPQRGAVLLMALLLLARTGARLAGPQVVRALLDAASAGATLRALTRAALLFLAFKLAGDAANVLATYASERVAWRATNGLRAELCAHLLRLDLDFFHAHPPGELLERVDGDVGALGTFFSTLSVDLLGAVLLLAGILAALWFEDPRLAAVLASFSALAMVFLAWLRRFAPPHLRAERACQGDFFGYLGEVLGAAEDLRACGAAGYVRRRFLEHLRAWLAVLRRALVWGASMWWGEVAVGALAFALARGLGATLLGRSLTLGTLYMLLAYVGQLVWGPLSGVGGQLQALQRAEASVARVRELLKARSCLREGAALLPGGPLSVEFRGVRFAYPGAKTAGGSRSSALQGVSFTLPAGRTLGLLGRTGSGKTTLGRLLYRFYDPQEGEVRLGGVDLRETSLAPLRARIGLVTQEVQLLEGTLRDNLSFFASRARLPDRRLLDALDALGLARWLARFPAGLDTHLTGAQLSAGEAQLVALARVYLKDPGLLILDEASSRLDPATEALLDRALDRLLAGRTTLIIAHRLSTLARADEVLLLEQGRVVEHGPRAALAADPDSRLAQLLRTGLEEETT